MPADYSKAKRNVTKLVGHYFDLLKEEVKMGARLFLDRAKFNDIEPAITAYVGLRYNDKPPRLDVRPKAEESKAKEKNLLLAYLPEGEKLVTYNFAGKMSVAPLSKGNYKLPDVATPLAFEGSAYLMDPCNFDLRRKVFVPEGPAFCISPDGKLKEMAPPLYFRSKCAVVRRGEIVYLLGGEATDRKILTNRCERYSLKTQSSEEISPMRHKHVCPSACFLGHQLWVFSSHYLEVFEGEEWLDVGMPFGGRFLPFQFLLPINDQEILIFGGVNRNEKSREVHVYNASRKNINSYGRLLPQGVSNERNSGAAVVQGCVAAISSVQASVYPQVGIKSNMCEVTYLFEASAYLNSVLVL
jgi:hypothetical protein